MKSRKSNIKTDLNSQMIERSHKPMVMLDCLNGNMTPNRAARLLLRLICVTPTDLARVLIREIKKSKSPRRKILQFFSQAGDLAHKLWITKMNSASEPRYLVEFTRPRQIRASRRLPFAIDDYHWM